MARYTRLDCPHSYSDDLGVDIALKYISKDKKSVLYLTVCKACAEKYRIQGKWLIGEEEISQFLRSN